MWALSLGAESGIPPGGSLHDLCASPIMVPCGRVWCGNLWGVGYRLGICPCALWSELECPLRLCLESPARPKLGANLQGASAGLWGHITPGGEGPTRGRLCCVISALNFSSGFHRQQGCTGSVAQPFPTLCDPMDCCLPGSTVHGIIQTKILEWVAIFSCRGSSQPRDQTYVSCISCISRQILYHCTLWEALSAKSPLLKFCLILRPVQKKNSCNKSCRTSTWPTLPSSAFDEPPLAQWAHPVCALWSVHSIMHVHTRVCVKCCSHPLHYLSDNFGKKHNVWLYFHI